MTWLGDETIKIAGNERDVLLTKREDLVKQVEKLVMAPLANKTQSAVIGRHEDLTNLAKKIKNIDKKLGRNT